MVAPKESLVAKDQELISLKRLVLDNSNHPVNRKKTTKKYLHYLLFRFIY